MTYDSVNRHDRCYKRRRRWIIVRSLTLAVAIVVGQYVERLQAQPPEVPAVGPRHENPHAITGVGSCIAAGCHGGGRPEEIVGSEYNIWISKDPHAEAYSTLFSDRSLRMARLLAGSSSASIVPPHEDMLCLACHSMAGGHDGDTANLREIASDGVGCEACHGAGGNWLDVHFEHQLSHEERDQLGMVDTGSLRVRAQICVACHVAGPGRDVNHELIAAGHPRLQFSMSAYWDALPKHWIDAKDRKPWGANYDALVWFFGQAATSESALRQLAARAKDGETWPEFAGLSCVACHHDLSNDPLLQKEVAARGKLSGRTIAWDSWNHFATRELAADISTAFAADTTTARSLHENLERVAAGVQDLNFDDGARTELAAEAARSADLMSQWTDEIESGSLDRSRLDALAWAALDRSIADKSPDWSKAAQAYDLLASLHLSRLRSEGGSKSNDAAFSKVLAQLYDDLAAGAGTIPGNKSAPSAVQQRLIELRKLVSPDGGAP